MGEAKNIYFTCLKRDRITIGNQVIEPTGGLIFQDGFEPG